MPELQSTNMKHFMIAHLLAQGKPQSVVARKLNISPSTIQNCLKTPSFLFLLEDLKTEYAERIADKVVLPFAEMQRKLNEEALGALSRVIDISCGERVSATVLNANLALLDRASNTPKASKGDTGEAPRDLFNVSVVQLVLETALQVGDKSILNVAERALKAIPQHTIEQGCFIDSPPEPELFDLPANKAAAAVSPFAMKSLDDLLYNEIEEDEE